MASFICFCTAPSLLGGAGMAQWWERSPPTNVARVRFLDPASYVGRVCCWFSTLLRGFFSGYSGFPPSTKTNTPKFQFDLETVDEEPPRGNATANSLLLLLLLLLFLLLLLQVKPEITIYNYMSHKKVDIRQRNKNKWWPKRVTFNAIYYGETWLTFFRGNTEAK